MMRKAGTSTDNSFPVKPTRQRMSFFVAVMVMFGITTTLHGLSPLSTYGLGALFYLGLAVIGFLIPAGLIAAELATAWPQEGGVYRWVGEAFGDTAGFFATWLQWQQNLIFWTVILTGSAAMLAIGFGATELAANRWYVVGVVIATIWLTTLLSAFGLSATGWLGLLGSLGGTILPGVVLVVLAVLFVRQGGHSHLSLDPATLLPDLTQPGNLSFAISTILIFAGVEVMGTRAGELQNPQRTYPRATFVSILMTVALLAPVTLSISMLVPVEELNIAAGLVQAVQAVLRDQPGFFWVPAFFAIALWLDSVGEIGGWMAGTPVAMARAGRDGFLPKRLSQRSERTAAPMLYAQAVLGSLICLAFTLIPDVQSVFWLLSALLVQLYVLMYMLLFAAAWRLRHSQPEQPRPFIVPGGRIGMAIICLIGLWSCIAVFAFGFVRPSSLEQVDELQYLGLVIGGLTLSLAMPTGLALARRRKRRPAA